MSEGKIELSRPDLYGKDHVSNTLSFKVSGMNFMPQDFRCISFDATDPNLQILSKAAAKIRDVINAAFESNNFVARVEFMRVANPKTGIEEQVISVKLNQVAVVQGAKKSGLTIRNLQQVSFSAGELAIALSSDNQAKTGTEKHGDYDVPIANFNPNLNLGSIDLNGLGQNADIYQEYKPEANTDSVSFTAYESTYRHMGETVSQHGSANYIIGQDSTSGGMFSSAKIIFYTLGASSCGGCAATSFTLSKAMKAANGELASKFGNKAPKVEIQAVKPEKLHFAVYKP